MTLPSWVEVEVLEKTPNVSYLIIPHLPSEEEVESEEMMAVAGGRAYWSPYPKKILWRRPWTWGRRPWTVRW